MPSWVKEYLKTNPDLAALPVHKRARHSIHFRRPDGEIEAHFVGAPCHYEASPGDWQEINTDLVDRGGYHSPTGVPIRVTDGEVSIEGGSYKQKPARIVRLRPSTQAVQQIQNIPAGGAVVGSSVVQDGGSWSHTIRFLENGVRETLTLNSQPTFPGGTQPTDYICIETVVTGITFPDGWMDTEYIADGYYFHLPTAHDANNNSPVTRRYALNSGGIQYLYTGVPASWLQAAAYPVDIDPDFSETGTDTYVYGSDATYSVARSTSTSYLDVATTVTVGQSNISGFNVNRAFLRFDTTALSGSIASVRLRLVAVNDYSIDSDFDVQIVKQDWSSQYPISDANRETAYDNCLSGTLDNSIWRNTLGLSINTQYSSGALDTSWPVSGGITYYSLRSSRDASGTQPGASAQEHITIASVRHATTSYRPVLVIVIYSTAIIVGWPSTVGTIPSGWTRDAALDANFLKGAAASTQAGDTGGALTHTHTTTAHNHACDHVHTVPNSGNAVGTVANDSGSTYAPDAHAHTSNPGTVNPTVNTLSNDSTTTGSGSNEPAYYTLIFIGKASATGIPDKCIAMWNEVAGTPSGWNLCDGGGAPARPNITEYVKGAAVGADGGGTGGGTHTHNTDHAHGGTYSHTHPDVTSAAGGGTATGADISGPSRSTTIKAHTHPLTIGTVAPVVTSASSNAPTEEKEPPYFKLAYIQNTSGGDSLPNKLIAIWNGLLASIPSPWVLCDGTNSTPDLRGKFIKSAVTLGGIGGTGGAVGHSHTATGTHTHPVASHVHTVTRTNPALSTSTGGSTNISSQTHTHTWADTGAQSFTSGTATTTIDNNVDTQPPFYTVQFIQYQSSSAIKTVQGLTKSSVKTINGLAIGSVKTLQGLA